MFLKRIEYKGYLIHLYTFFPSSVFPVPRSLFPVPCSPFPVPRSLFPKNIQYLTTQIILLYQVFHSKQKQIGAISVSPLLSTPYLIISD